MFLNFCLISALYFFHFASLGGSQNKKPPESVQHKEEKLDTLPPTPPRAPVVTDNKQSNRPKQRRAKALYDCAADHDDELEFF